jgi:hypothetical protein
MLTITSPHSGSSSHVGRARRRLGKTRTVLVPLALLFGAAACTTGQIGGEVDADGNEGSHDGGCEIIARTPLEVGDSQALGFSAQDMMDAISGVHETSLSWGEEISQNSVSITPAAGETTLTVEVRPKADTAQLVDLQPRESSGEEALIGEIGSPACSDEIRIEAEVIVTSGNGALSDTFDVVFRAASVDVIRGSVQIQPGQLNGAFDFDVSGSAEAVQTTLELSFALGTLSGEISGLLQQVHGDAVSASPLVYAKFPVDGCDTGALISADSPWGAAIHGAVQAATEFEFTWESGGETVLSIEPTVGKLCLEGWSLSGEGSHVVAPASAAVVTEDGRIEGNWDLQLSASVNAGSVTSAQLRYVGTYEQGYFAEEFQEATGISGFESDASDIGFLFDYSIDVSGEDLAQGSFAIVELIVPDCARPDYEPEVTEDPGGGSSVPGCEGIDLVEIETASFRQLVD